MARKKLHTELGQDSSLFKPMFSWESPERMWEQRDRAWYISYGLFFVVLMIPPAIWGFYIWIVGIIAFMFLWFVQAATPPEIGKYTVTTLGVKAYEKLFPWKRIAHYWFSRKGDITFINLDVLDPEFTSGKRLHRLSIIVPEELVSQLFDELLDKVDYGDKKEIGYNILVAALHGEHVNITEFLPENVEQEDYLALQGKEMIEDAYDPEDLKKEK